MHMHITHDSVTRIFIKKNISALSSVRCSEVWGKLPRPGYINPGGGGGRQAAVMQLHPVG